MRVVKSTIFLLTIISLLLVLLDTLEHFLISLRLSLKNYIFTRLDLQLFDRVRTLIPFIPYGNIANTMIHYYNYTYVKRE